MKLTIFAATGGVGRHLLEQAVAAGHEVTAVVRNPDGLSRPVRAITADLRHPEPAALTTAVTGADAVLSGLGPRRRAEYGIVGPGTRAIAAAMAAADVRRIVVVSVAGAAALRTPGRPTPRPDPGAGPLVRYLLGPLSQLVLRRHYADVAQMEEALRGSGLAWTAVGVPLLTDNPPTGAFRVAYGQSVPRGLKIARADAAAFMLATLDRPETIGQSVSVAY